MKLVIAFGVAALFLLLPDAYIALVVMGGATWRLRGLFLLPTLVYFVVVMYAVFCAESHQRKMNLVFRSTLAIFLPVLIFAIVSLVGLALSRFYSPLWQIFNWIGLGLCCVWLAGVTYGITVGWKRVAVEKVELGFVSLPSKFDGYKIAQLSDLHIGTYLSAPEAVTRIVDAVNALNPDLIVFTGDLVNSAPDEIRPFVGDLRRLKARDGILSVLGNHDYCLYRKYNAPATPMQATREVIGIERELGWEVLLNQSARIRREGEEIAVIGVENAGDRHFVDRSDLGKAMAGIPKQAFKILLSHDPTHWRREVVGKTDIDLMLAGHTHAMQFRIGRFSPSQWVYKEWGGVYRAGAQALVVSTGTGGNVAFRLGVYPQILLLTLKKR